MRQRFENTSGYDPGRYRHILQFVKNAGRPDGFGGTEPVQLVTKNIRAIKREIREGDQTAIVAGVTVLMGGVYFVIRRQTEWQPDKAMQIVYGGRKYEIKALIPVDEPQRYWKILAQWQI